MTRSEMAQAIHEFPGDRGWWHTSGEHTFLTLAERMVVDHGIQPGEAVEILERAYSATADQFGG